jgi:type IV pilus assembly protein PilQ
MRNGMIKYLKPILLCFTLTTFLSANEQKLVSVHAEEANISTILAILAQESGYNIVTGPLINKDDRLTIHLEETPINQAINLVVRAAGLSYEFVGNSILVAQQARLNQEVGVSPHVFSLQYSNAMDVLDLLANVTENITVDKSGNKLLVTASPKTIAEIAEIVKQVDIPATQIMLEARLIEVAISEEEKLGIDWAKLASISSILVENANPLNFPDGTSTGSLFPGFGWSRDDEGNLVEESEPQKYGSVPTNMYYDRLGAGGIGFSRQMTAFDVTLDFLLKNNKAEVLANSQVVTINGHEASISMVDVVPYILSSGGVGGQVQVQREEVGIKLNILPTINTDGYITTTITPEVSSIYDFIGPDQNIPWVKKRISNTTIRVKDNESIIIAGLLGADRKFTKHRFPLLWRIPYIGERFFTHTVEHENKTDLVIQITPKVIKDNYSGIDKKPIHSESEKIILNSIPVEDKE